MFVADDMFSMVICKLFSLLNKMYSDFLQKVGEHTLRKQHELIQYYQTQAASSQPTLVKSSKQPTSENEEKLIDIITNVDCFIESKI